MSVATAGSYELPQLVTELGRRDEVLRDFLVPRGAMNFVSFGPKATDGKRSVLDFEADGASQHFTLNRYAHGQMADRLHIPKRYYEVMREAAPGLLDRNVNHWLRFAKDDEEESPNWLVRTLDGQVIALLSDRYRSIEYLDVAQTVFPILAGLDGIEVVSCGLTDTHLYIKAKTPKVAGEVAVGDDVCAGVLIKTSDVGAGSLIVAPFVYRKVCSNGMVVMRRGEGMMRQIHLGERLVSDEQRNILRDETRRTRDRAFLMEVGDYVRAAVDEARFHKLLKEMSEAAQSKPIENVKAGVEVIRKRHNLGQGEADDILTYLAKGGDLSHWGLVNAVTRYAQDVGTYDRQTELEELGGQMLGYTPRQWNEVANATSETVS